MVESGLLGAAGFWGEEGDPHGLGRIIPDPDQPAEATADADGVTIAGSGNHGLFIEDQVLNSAAGIALELDRVRIEGNGFGDVDQDGVRVNEGGLGSIRLTIKQSDFVGNGADGLELDEKDDGDATIKVVATTFRENGPKDPTDLDDGLDVDEDGDGAISGRIVLSAEPPTPSGLLRRAYARERT